MMENISESGFIYTPRHFFTFIDTYKKVLISLKSSGETEKEHLVKGLEKLNEA